MKQNWQIKKLGDVCEIINGRNQREVLDEKGPYPVYGSGGVMGYATNFLCRENSIIIGRKGSINNPIYVEEKFWNVDTAFGLQSKENYIPKLLFYFCKSFDFSTHNKGTTIPSLVKSDLLEIPIPLPPLEEQKRIVVVLDKKFAQIETLKTTAKKNLQNAKQLFQSELEKAFSTAEIHNTESDYSEGTVKVMGDMKMKQNWQMKKLGEVCEFQNGFSFKSSLFVNTGLPILRISNIQKGGIDLKDIVYFDEKSYQNNFDNFKVFPNDIVIAMSGGTTGKIGRNNTNNILYLNQRVGKFKPSKMLDDCFLYYYLSTKSEESLKIAAGAAQPNLSTEQINNFIIPLPLLEEQKCIVAHLDSLSEKVHQLEENYTKQLADCDELKQSLLQKAFEGEL